MISLVTYSTKNGNYVLDLDLSTREGKIALCDLLLAADVIRVLINGHDVTGFNNISLELTR